MQFMMRLVKKYWDARLVFILTNQVNSRLRNSPEGFLFCQSTRFIPVLLSAPVKAQNRLRAASVCRCTWPTNLTSYKWVTGRTAPSANSIRFQNGTNGTSNAAKLHPQTANRCMKFKYES